MNLKVHVYILVLIIAQRRLKEKKLLHLESRNMNLMFFPITASAGVIS